MLESSLEVFGPVHVENSVRRFHLLSSDPQVPHHSFIDKILGCAAVNKHLLFGLPMCTYEVKWYMYCTDFTNIHDTRVLHLNPSWWTQAP